jgi:dienelactone hydrolase
VSNVNAQELAGWERSSFSSANITHVTYRKGSGPGVVVVHEIPGITPAVLRFAEEVVQAGFTVVMPLLVGEAGREVSGQYIASSMSKICVSREFTTLAVQQTSPVISWLRALARQLHEEVGGPGVGAIGMCFSGGFALGMMLDERPHFLLPSAKRNRVTSTCRQTMRWLLPIEQQQVVRCSA